jgi:hypothetical protein
MEVIAKLLLRYSGESRKTQFNVHDPVFSVSSEPRLSPLAMDEPLLQLAQMENK